MKFSEQIIQWYNENKRNLAWRLTKDPYKIWLSEVIMQQTQIIQGTSYYNNFIKQFPDIFALAQAEEQDVLVLWQGLGYYSRARNLHHTAQEIVRMYGGKFPETYKELTALKGIGDYTASAILSICFNQPRPAVDGNVIRVISRLFELTEPMNKSIGKKKVKELAEKLISKTFPGDFNQALMDFGSMQCRPKNPNCEFCFISNSCSAHKNSSVGSIPVKEKQKLKTKEYFNYFICLNNKSTKFIIQKRTEGIWKNLYEFFLIHTQKRISEETAVTNFMEKHNIKSKIIFKRISPVQNHILSHKSLFVRFYTIKFVSDVDFFRVAEPKNLKVVSRDELAKYPFPVIIRKYIDLYF